jgi:hypothetical protein
MAWKRDVKEGISAEVAADHEAVVAACRKAADQLGRHARVEADEVRITVSFLPGLSPKLSYVSSIMGIAVRQAGPGRLRLDSAVERYRLKQTTFLGFIPAGPKTLVGRGQFLRYLTALEAELGALDPAAGSVRRHDPSVA